MLRIQKLHLAVLITGALLAMPTYASSEELSGSPSSQSSSSYDFNDSDQEPSDEYSPSFPVKWNGDPADAYSTPMICEARPNVSNILKAIYNPQNGNPYEALIKAYPDLTTLENRRLAVDYVLFDVLPQRTGEANEEKGFSSLVAFLELTFHKVQNLCLTVISEKKKDILTKEEDFLDHSLMILRAYDSPPRFAEEPNFHYFNGDSEEEWDGY